MSWILVDDGFLECRLPHSLCHKSVPIWIIRPYTCLPFSFVTGTKIFITCSINFLALAEESKNLDLLLFLVHHNLQHETRLYTTCLVSGVPRGDLGFSTPPPKFRRPSKLVPNSTRLWKLLKIAEFRVPTSQDVRKKGSKILKLPRFAIVLH